MCFMMFYYVYQCFMMFTSLATRDRNNAAGIGDISAEIGDGATGIVDIAANVIPC